MTSATLITQYLGQGLAAARPATPAIDAGAIGYYYATDTNALSYYANGAWHTLSASDPSIAPFLAVPANPGWDPLFIGKSGAVVLSNSNKTATPASGAPYNHLFVAPAAYTGKRYWEIVPGSTSFCNLGFTGAAGHLKNGDGNTLGSGVATGQVGIDNSGNIHVTQFGTNSFVLATGPTWAAGDRVSFAMDLDNALWWYRDAAGAWSNSGNPVAGTGGYDLSWAWAGAGNRLVWPGMNAGNSAAHSIYLKSADFTQAVPSGFGSWSGL